jgi:hypothetical protein
MLLILLISQLKSSQSTINIGVTKINNASVPHLIYPVTKRSLPISEWVVTIQVTDQFDVNLIHVDNYGEHREKGSGNIAISLASLEKKRLQAVNIKKEHYR